MPRLEKMPVRTGKARVGVTATSNQMREASDFAIYDDLLVADTFDSHKTFRKITWHIPDWKTHVQVDYIVVKKRFSSSVNIAKTSSFPGTKRSRAYYDDF